MGARNTRRTQLARADQDREAADYRRKQAMATSMNQTPTQAVERDGRLANKWLPLPVWPVALLLIGMIVCRFLPTSVEDGPSMLWALAAFGPLLMSLLVVGWWLFASRARWFERVLGFSGIVIACIISSALLDKTMLGPAISVYMIPLGMALFGLSAIVCSRMLSIKRTLVAVVMAACGFGSATLLRTDGMWGNFAMQLYWRWTPTSDEQIASRAAESVSQTSAVKPEALVNPQWPSFRGSEANSRYRGTKLSSDWSKNPPKQIWKNVIGPGWSSFAVAGESLFTQEQRSEMECVVCYDATTGKEVWVEKIESRFEDPLGGPGPRATPTIANGKLFTMGGTGWLQSLNPLDGGVIWKKDLRELTSASPPMWGFSSSPLVVGNLVVVHAGGTGDTSVWAFNIDSGELVWSAPCGKDSYSSPQLCSIAGEDSIVMLSNLGMTLLDPVSGAVRLDYKWALTGYRSLQPQMLDANSMLIPSGMGYGTRLVKLEKSEGEYSAQEVWTSRQLKPDFNDFVVYQGHAYGFDALIFTCIDLATGKQKWKGGRYGKGQVLLVEDSGHLLVASEEGEIVLLAADPSGHKELGTIAALEGRTWNHPVLIGNKLFVRNSQEAACFELPTIDSGESVAVASGAVAK